MIEMNSLQSRCRYARHENLVDWPTSTKHHRGIMPGTHSHRRCQIVPPLWGQRLMRRNQSGATADGGACTRAVLEESSVSSAAEQTNSAGPPLMLCFFCGLLYLLCSYACHPTGLFVCEANDTDYDVACFWCSFADSDCAFCAAMPAATAHATIRHDASGLRTARAHVGHLFLRSGGSCGTCVVLFVCEGNDTDYLVACFWCSFADADCAVCAGCQLRLRMIRAGMMHRGCGRPVRTLRSFCDDRAAPMAPVLCFLCAKEMTPIIW